MAKLNLLTVKAVEAAKPADKIVRLYDGGGLYLEIKPTGQRGWRYKFHLHGRERRMSLGPATSISLAQARELRREAEQLKLAGIDPVEVRRERVAAEIAKFDAAKLTFTSLVWPWCDQYHERGGLAATTKLRNERILKYLEADVGSTPIALLTRKAILKSVERIKHDNGTETATRALALCHRFFENMMIEHEDIVRGDPTTGIRKILGKVEHKPRAGVQKESEIRSLLQSIWTYDGSPITIAAMKLMAHTFLRSKELRFAKWGEVNFEAEEWLIPPARMKYRKNPRAKDLYHYVALTPQTLEVLQDLWKITGDGPDTYIFPSYRRDRPISENTINGALASMGFTGKHTQHGFRKTAPTRLAALGFDAVHVKRQSGRLDGGIEGVYNQYDYKAERKTLLFAWSDYLDQIRTGANILAIGSKQAVA